MTNHTDLQLSPALALVQLLSEHQVRPYTTWSIGDDVLEGRVYGPQCGGQEAIDWWAGVLGVQPEPRHLYTYAGQRLQVMQLAAWWRDVRVVVEVSLLARDVVEPSEVVLSNGTTLRREVSA